MQAWNLRAARLKCRTQKSPKSRHLGTIAQLCRAISSQLRHASTIGKNFLSSNISPIIFMSSQYGEFRPTSGWDVLASLGTPGNFNGFRVLAALLHGILVVGVSQTLRRWTKGATYVRQGDHHVGHWPTFLVLLFVFGRWQHNREFYCKCRRCDEKCFHLQTRQS